MLIKRLTAGVLLFATLPVPKACAWGKTAHAVIDGAAIDMLSQDGPVFLKKYKEYIMDSASIPDTWRGNGVPFSKIEEDPNHGWFREQFAFMQTIPRSRYEFVIALYKENMRLQKTDPAMAAKMNVRWTGTLPFAAMEVYGHLVADMRSLRGSHDKQHTANLETTCAMYTFWLGHYIGDGAQPLHDTIQHDGWVGPNPNNFTRDHSIHARFESDYVDRIALSEKDILPRIKAFTPNGADTFDHVIDFLVESGTHVEEVYQLDQTGAFSGQGSRKGRELIYDRTAAAAQMLRDLLQQAWLESGVPEANDPMNPTSEKNPAYNPETGSAPATRSRAIPKRRLAIK